MNTPRCNEHKDRTEAPRLCTTCQRIAVEQEIVVRTVCAMLAAGYALQTDIRDDPRPKSPTTDRDVILAEMMAVDDEFLGVFYPVEHPTQSGERYGWIRFVYGNSGYDVINDYTVNLGIILDPIFQYADTLV